MTEADFSNTHLGAGGAIIIAAWLTHKDNGTPSKLVFRGDQYQYWNGNEYEYVIPEPATLELGMTEADLSNKGLQAAGASIVAAWISHRDKGAMTTLDLSSNAIGAEGATHIAEALKSNVHTRSTFICQLSGVAH
jgi:hypothetical protein